MIELTSAPVMRPLDVSSAAFFSNDRMYACLFGAGHQCRTRVSTLTANSSDTCFASMSIVAKPFEFVNAFVSVNDATNR